MAFEIVGQSPQRPSGAGNLQQGIAQLGLDGGVPAEQGPIGIREHPVGGGAAGFFAAITAAEASPNVRVTLLERGAQLLSKVRIILFAKNLILLLNLCNENVICRNRLTRPK